MEDHEIRVLVAAFDTKKNTVRDSAWEQLCDLGERVLPFFEEFFPLARRYEARRDIAFHCIFYARTHESAFRIGLAAIADKSTIVRYRGCCILAYSLRRDAIASLQLLLNHADTRTAEDAHAAIDAIQCSNHHYFVDRTHSGRSLWQVRPEDVA